jgi:DNA (cytosine-5)-methyltransferase 1
MRIVSLFSGCGGLDIGFKKAGFNIIWANEKAQGMWETYEKNHPGTQLDRRNICKISSEEIPDCVGIIGGPPCQSWSSGGKGRGKNDPRGKLFFEFIRILTDKQPQFFVAENVAGMLAKKHEEAFDEIKSEFEKAGYNVSIALLNASDFNVPQDRLRFFFVGYRKDLNKIFVFPRKSPKHVTVKDAIWDLRKGAMQAMPSNRSNCEKCKFPNHEYWVGGYSYIFMSRNRVLSWDKPSYTLQATARQISLHPQAPKMIKVEKDVRKFKEDKLSLYRRLTVRECARLQTFPDDFIFYYSSLEKAYEMIGNAVPVNLSLRIAKAIYMDMLSSASMIKSKHGFVTTIERSELMKKIRSTHTSSEVLLQEKINELGVEYVLNEKSILGKPDIFFPKNKLVIFIDGEFWHGYNWKEKRKRIKRNKNYWIMKIESNIKRDKRNQVRLKKEGYKVLRFWEMDIKKDVEGCVDKIVKFLN